MNTVPHPEQKKPDAELVSLLHSLEQAQFNGRCSGDIGQKRIARHLDTILGRAQFCLETEGDEADRVFAKAALFITQLVCDFEELSRL